MSLETANAHTMSSSLTGRVTVVTGAASGTVAGLRGSAQFVGYPMAKHAMVGHTQTATLELGSLGLRVSAVCPRRVDTPIVKPLNALGDQAEVVAQRSISRMAWPSEIASLVVWVLRDEAWFATGCAYPTDGGLTA
jgi:NAD(P)-dependent dehydrogenase (short-subunit alcohol dehydrogenase family)